MAANTLRVSKSESKLEARAERYGNKNTTVFASVNTNVEIEVCYLMDIIIDNWTSIDKNARHKFARTVSALDLKDSLRLLDSSDEAEEPFKWR